MPVNCILEVLNQHCQMDPDLPILVGVSGGPDSLMLLHVLHGAGLRVIAAHLDHGLRESSTREGEYLAELCERWRIACVTGKSDVNGYSMTHKLSIEEAARECRYRFLFEQANRMQTQAVAVGHNADDQVETVLMHFLRGAGTGGLKGMAYREFNAGWSNTIPIWRPMLGIWRNEVITYCEANGLEPVMDESNRDTVYFRNRLRHVLLPELKNYNPQIKRVLWRTASVMQADDALLQSLTEEAWHAVVVTESKEMISIDYEGFQSLQEGLKRRILRRAIDQMRAGLRDIGLDVVERAIHALEKPSMSGRMDLAAKLDLIIGTEVITLVEQGASLPPGDVPQMAENEGLALSPGGAVQLKNGWELTAEMMTADELARVSEVERNHPDHAWLDGAGVKIPLTVRGRKPGDRWKPLGLGGHRQKISDLYINEKIPEPARAGWPLVVSADEIIWVVGARPCETFRLKGDEKSILHLKVARN